MPVQYAPQGVTVELYMLQKSTYFYHVSDINSEIPYLRSTFRELHLSSQIEDAITTEINLHIVTIEQVKDRSAIVWI